MQYKDYVDLTVCANLDRRQDRWDFMSRQFLREGMVVHRLASVDCQKPLPWHGPPPVNDIDAMPEHVWNQGNTASTYTFVMALALAKASRARTFLYLEDDAILPTGFTNALAQEMRWVPPDWEVLNLGPWFFRRGLSINDRVVRNTITLNSHALLVHQRCYDTLLPYLLQMRATTAWGITSIRSLKYYSTVGLQLPQRVGWSDIFGHFFGTDAGRVCASHEDQDLCERMGKVEGLSERREEADGEFYADKPYAQPTIDVIRADPGLPPDHQSADEKEPSNVGGGMVVPIDTEDES
jgi:hypothetical protein